MDPGRRGGHPYDGGTGCGPGAVLTTGRGFLTGTVDRTGLDSSDFRSSNERIQTDANQAIADTVRQVAEQAGAAPAQVALAWVYTRTDRLGVPIVPIPGTKRTRWLEQNVASLDLTLDDAALAQLQPLADQVAGERYGVTH